MSYRWPCIALFFCALVLQPLTAQPDSEALDKPFGETIDINIVNVEVFVTDRDGKPVKGLDRDQFQVFEDGERMQLTHFSAVKGSTGGETISTLEGEAPPETVLEPIAEESFLVFYFDNIHLRPNGRKRAIEGLKSFMTEGKDWNGKLMIAAATGTSFEIFHPFGAGLNHALTALDRIAELPALGIQADGDRRTTFDGIRDIWETYDSINGFGRIGLGSPCAEGQKQMEALIQTYSSSARARSSRALSGLARLSSSLAGLPGQKAVIFISDGMEINPGNDVAEYLYQVCPELTTSHAKDTTLNDMSRRFAELTSHANANRVTFYALDAAGMRSTSSMGIEGDDPQFVPSLTVDSARRANIESSLSFIADETGGRSVFNANNFAPIFAELGEDLTSYYSLGYRPLHAGDDRVHNIEVKIKGEKKLRVRHRRTYRDKPSEERMADRTLGALLHGLQENPLGAHMALGRIRAMEEGHFSVPVQIAVPIKNLVLVPDADRQVGYLRLMMAVRDADGMITPIRQKELGVVLSAEQLAKEDQGAHSFVVEMEMRSGEHAVAVAIRDEMSGSTSYLASRLNVEAAL